MTCPVALSRHWGPITTGLGEVYFYALEAKEKAMGDERIEQLMQLRALNEWFVKPRLSMVKGVAEVNSIGGYEKTIFCAAKAGRAFQVWHSLT